MLVHWRRVIIITMATKVEQNNHTTNSAGSRLKWVKRSAITNCCVRSLIAANIWAYFAHFNTFCIQYPQMNGYLVAENSNGTCSCHNVTWLCNTAEFYPFYCCSWLTVRSKLTMVSKLVTMVSKLVTMVSKLELCNDFQQLKLGSCGFMRILVDTQFQK